MYGSSEVGVDVEPHYSAQHENNARQTKAPVNVASTFRD